MSKRKPHNQDAGYICELIFKPSASHIVIYRAAEQGIDCGGDKYAVVCSKHGAIVGDTNLPGARLSMKYPAFCEQCMSTVQAANDKAKEERAIEALIAMALHPRSEEITKKVAEILDKEGK